MRICHIAFNFFPGQGLTDVYEYTRHEAQTGLTTAAIVAGRLGESTEETVEGITVWRIPVRSLHPWSLDRMQFIKRAIQLSQRHNFDLVHVYAFNGAGLLPLFTKRNKTKWLYNIRSTAIKPPFINLRNKITRYESNNYDAVITLSDGIRKIIFGSQDAADIVPLGADLHHFRTLSPDLQLQAQYEIKPTEQILLYCGTLARIRRLDQLVQGFALALQELPQIRLLLIGEGKSRPELENLSKNLNLGNRLIMTGYVPFNNLPRYFSLAKVGLAYVPMISVYEHQPPLKTVEYLAAGLPVIATDTTGNRMFVKDGHNGLLTKDTPEAVAEKITALLGGKIEFYQQLQQNSRSSVQQYHWGRIVQEQLIPIYQKVLDGA